MTASREPAHRPADDAPTVRLRLVGDLPTPNPRPRMTLVGDLPEPQEQDDTAQPLAQQASRTVPQSARPQKSRARRIARKILGPNLLTKRD